MKHLCIFLLCILLFQVSESEAGSYQGEVTNVFAYGSKVFVTVKNGSFDNSTTCTGSTTELKLWLDPSTDYGKALLSIVLTAKTTERVVWTLGSNSCISGPTGQAEELSAIDLKG